jgi:hypothetical protein
MTEITKTERLAAALLADRNRATSQHNIIACFVCGHTFVYRGRRFELNGRFCSMRCQDWYDAGNEPIGEETIYRRRDGKPMRKGAKGLYIDCANCRKKFEKLGHTLLLAGMRAELLRAAREPLRHGRSRH